MTVIVPPGFVLLNRLFKASCLGILERNVPGRRIVEVRWLFPIVISLNSPRKEPPNEANILFPCVLD